MARYKESFANLLILIGVVFILLAVGPLIYDEIWYSVKELKHQEFTLNNPQAQGDSAFARLLSSKPILINPVNTEFSIVIEKIGVNAPIKADVSVTDEKAYLEALKDGIAHAVTSPYPSQEAGNVYLFAHSSLNFWQLGRYSRVFNLLRKLEIGDKIHVFYEGKEFVYKTVNIEVLDGWNTYPLTRPVIEPTLTLQTCDPPGTTLNRLVVTANLIEMR